MSRHEYHAHWTLPAALALLPPRLDSPPARALLVAIGLQESEFRARRQQPRGPARGFWQFELAGGVAGVLTHAASAPLIHPILETLCVTPAANACHVAIEHNDVLAAVFARLLLWTVPGTLPGPDDPAGGWHQYLRGWRPGAPRPESWVVNYRRAWAAIEEGARS
jgi:hypothetical protein